MNRVQQGIRLGMQCFSKLKEIEKHREAWRDAVCGVAEEGHGIGTEQEAYEESSNWLPEGAPDADAENLSMKPGESGRPEVQMGGWSRCVPDTECGQDDFYEFSSV